MRLRFDKDEDLRSVMWTILEENSTPMVCEERTRHSSRTKRCRRHDLGVAGQYRAVQVVVGIHPLARTARPKQYCLRKVVIHAPQLLNAVSSSSLMLRMSVPTCVGASPLRVEATDVARFRPMLTWLCVLVAVQLRAAQSTVKCRWLLRAPEGQSPVSKLGS